MIHPAIAQVMLTNGLEGTIAAPTFPAFTTRMSDIVPQLVVFPSRGPRVGAKDKLIALLPNYPDQEELKRLSQKELVELVAERYTYGAMSSGFRPKTREDLRSMRRGSGGELAQAAAAKPPPEDSSSGGP